MGVSNATDHLMGQAQVVGAAVTGTSAAASWLATANSVLQIIATVIAIVVGLATLYGMVKRWQTQRRSSQ